MLKKQYSWRRLLCAVAFLGLMAADSMQLLPAPMSGKSIEASFIPFHIISARKTYDQEGNFIGCLAGGNDCYIVYNTLTGDFNVSTEGIHAQP